MKKQPSFKSYIHQIDDLNFSNTKRQMDLTDPGKRQDQMSMFGMGIIGSAAGYSNMDMDTDFDIDIDDEYELDFDDEYADDQSDDYEDYDYYADYNFDDDNINDVTDFSDFSDDDSEFDVFADYGTEDEEDPSYYGQEYGFQGKPDKARLKKEEQESTEKDQDFEFDEEDMIASKGGIKAYKLKDEDEEESTEKQGIIRTVKGAHLVYKRQNEEGTYDELWIFNVTDNINDELQIRRAIIAGTDIPEGKTQSKDRTQKSALTTMGNAQLLKITGLPN